MLSVIATRAIVGLVELYKVTLVFNGGITIVLDRAKAYDLIGHEPERGEEVLLRLCVDTNDLKPA